jgi:hypothetical protein
VFASPPHPSVSAGDESRRIRMPRLDVYVDLELAVRVRLKQDSILIGRGPDCDVQVSIRRPHATTFASTGRMRPLSASILGRLGDDRKGK